MPWNKRTLALPASAPSVRLARDWVTGVLDDIGRHELAESARLAVSELVTNAILHAHGRLLVEATLRGSFVHLRVHDGSSREPVLGLPLDRGDPHRDNGRGLRLVERYCSAWGFLPRGDGAGKVVWATLRARPTDHRDLGGLRGSV